MQFLLITYGRKSHLFSFIKIQSQLYTYDIEHLYRILFTVGSEKYQMHLFLLFFDQSALLLSPEVSHQELPFINNIFDKNSSFDRQVQSKAIAEYKNCQLVLVIHSAKVQRNKSVYFSIIFWIF